MRPPGISLVPLRRPKSACSIPHDRNDGHSQYVTVLRIGDCLPRPSPTGRRTSGSFVAVRDAQRASPGLGAEPWHSAQPAATGDDHAVPMQRSKPDLVANSELRSSRPQPYLGHPPGVRPGDLFEGRGELAALGIHSLMSHGIDWHRGHPAFAVCLSGGYADDEDSGTVVWYTGMGGQHKQQQVKAQALEKVRVLFGCYVLCRVLCVCCLRRRAGSGWWFCGGRRAQQRASRRVCRGIRRSR